MPLPTLLGRTIDAPYHSGKVIVVIRNSSGKVVELTYRTDNNEQWATNDFKITSSKIIVRSSRRISDGRVAHWNE